MMYDFLDPRYEYMNLTSEEIFYDEIAFQEIFDLDVRDELMFVKMNKFQMAEFDKFGRKDYPTRNTVQMSQSEYH